MPPSPRRFLPPALLALRSAPATLRRLLLTDLLTLLAELGLAVALPWWINSHGGAPALATFSVALALAGFVIAPAVAPFGDRVCKSRQIRAGLLGLGVLTWGQASSASRP